MNTFFSKLTLLGSTLAVTAFITGANVTHAASKECYNDFRAAKKDGSLKEKDYKEYQVAHCKADVAKTETASVKTTSDNAKPAEVKQTEKKVSATAPAPAPAPAPQATGNVVFPNQISTKYAKEKEGIARRKTCLDQYHDNKTTDKNGGLKWIQKGGGYYSECVAHLKNMPAK